MFINWAMEDDDMSVLCKQLVTCYSSCVGSSHGNSLNKEVSDRMRSSLNKSMDFIYNLHTSSIGSNHIQGQLIVPKEAVLLL